MPDLDEQGEVVGIDLDCASRAFGGEWAAIDTIPFERVGGLDR